MQTVNPQIISGKRVLLRYDIDVALGKGTGGRLQAFGSETQARRVTEEFKLRAGLKTLDLCLQNAHSVIMIGHIGRPNGRVVDELRVLPIVEWFKQNGLSSHLTSGKLKILENLRFDPRESFDSAQDKEAVMDYAKELAGKGDFYVNEAFSSYRPAVSTTILPSLLQHAAGLRFAEEVRMLTNVRENPKKPFVAIMGGAKVEDKLPVIAVLAKKADAVLVGGKLIHEIREQNISLPVNVLVGKLSEDGFDIAYETVSAWSDLIAKAAMIVWNGPVGKIDNGQLTMDKLGTAKASYEIAKMVLKSNAEVVVGGGDTVAFLGEVKLLAAFEKKGFVSVGGGAMLKLLADGTLPTIKALE